MRLTLAFILSIVFAVGLVAFGFTFYQSSTERNKLIQELEIRTEQVTEDILQGDTFYIEKINQNNRRCGRNDQPYPKAVGFDL